LHRIGTSVRKDGGRCCITPSGPSIHPPSTLHPPSIFHLQSALGPYRRHQTTETTFTFQRIRIPNSIITLALSTAVPDASLILSNGRVSIIPTGNLWSWDRRSPPSRVLTARRHTAAALLGYDVDIPYGTAKYRGQPHSKAAALQFLLSSDQVVLSVSSHLFSVLVARIAK
jgi:hypothetical protein